MAIIELSDNVTLENVVDLSEELSMTGPQTLELLWGALNLARNTARVFNYSVNFANEHSECVAEFSRSFHHVDWIDGESIVQAEQTSLEEGFNIRFHNIENDLDSLGQDVAKAFSCIGEQRAEISARLDEIRTEINRINSDIHECCDKGLPFQPTPIPGYFEPPFFEPPHYGPPYWGGPGGWPGNVPQPDPLPPFVINPGYGNIYPRDPSIMFGAWRNGGAIDGRPWAGGNIDPVVRYMESVTGIHSFQAGENMVARSSQDPTLAVISGMQAKLIENNEFNGQKVEVWSTPAGLMLTPLPDGQENGAGERVGWTSPHIAAVGRFAGWVTENREKIQGCFDNQDLTLEEFNKVFGEDTLEGGLQVKKLLGAIPSSTRFETPLKIVDALAEISAKSITRTGSSAEAVIGAVGLNKGKKELESMSAGVVKEIEPKVADALMDVGIKSMKDLSVARPEDVSSKLKSTGIEVKPKEIAGWRSTAATLIRVDQIARNKG